MLMTPARRAAALTGCRLDEIEELLKTEVDGIGMALRLGDTKAGRSIRPVGSPKRTVREVASRRGSCCLVHPVGRLRRICSAVRDDPPMP
jgi:hypothetical protein